MAASDSMLIQSSSTLTCGGKAPTRGSMLIQSSSTLSRGSCYGELARLAVDEGNQIGSVVVTQSAAECQRRCSTNSQCKSVTLCPQYYGCWLKDRSLTGDE